MLCTVCVAAVLLVLTLGAAPALLKTAAAQAPAGSRDETIVSLTFDDATADQYSARYILLRHRMRATFYVPSGLIGTASFLTWEQVRRLAADGHEIGGHTLSHTVLTKLPADEQRHQICNDRTNLLGRGFHVTGFAYPESDSNPSVETIVRNCGYSYGRAVGGLREDYCDTCPYTESIPPPNPFQLRTPDPYDRYLRGVKEMQAYVRTAEETGGGWVQLVFHNICDRCEDSDAITEDDLKTLVAWLDSRKDRGTVVKTVQEVIDGTSAPSPADPTTPTPSADAMTDCDGVDCSRGPSRGWSRALLPAAALISSVPIAASLMWRRRKGPLRRRKRGQPAAAADPSSNITSP